MVSGAFCQMEEMDCTNYSFAIGGTNAFDDEYRNSCPDKDVKAGNFTLVPATLQVGTS
jgi:hypothetical protein